MGAVGEDYGSERHLLSYRKSDPDTLDRAILAALNASSHASINWWYPDQRGRRGEEFTGVGFLKASPWAPHTAKALKGWGTFWPTRGRSQSWDGIATLDVDGSPQRWLLIEAKANHPEFVGARCRASATSLKTIESVLNRTKKQLRVHRFFDWAGGYYQFANRLALTTFLNREGVPATLVELFFTSDRFPDDTYCPGCEEDWKPLLEARRLTLGLSAEATTQFVADVFLPAFKH